MQKNDILKLNGWMLTEHHLRGNELIVFAIAYMFRTSDSDYQLAMAKRWLRAFPRTTVLDALQSLLDQHLITEREHMMLKDLQHQPKTQRKKRTVKPETLEAFAARHNRKNLRRDQFRNAPDPFKHPTDTKN